MLRRCYSGIYATILVIIDGLRHYYLRFVVTGVALGAATPLMMFIVIVSPAAIRYATNDYYVIAMRALTLPPYIDTDAAITLLASSILLLQYVATPLHMPH